MEGVNKVILVGHLGRDAERAPVEFPLLKFTLAVSERRWTPHGYKTSTSWHNCVLRGGRVEALEKKLKKGVPVYIEGRLINRSYVGKDGLKRYVTEVEVGQQIILFPKGAHAADTEATGEPDDKHGESTDTSESSASAGSQQQHNSEYGDEGGVASYDDDVPF